MSHTVLASVFGAALFILFGLIRHRGCTGHCAGCINSCGHHEGMGDQQTES